MQTKFRADVVRSAIRQRRLQLEGDADYLQRGIRTIVDEQDAAYHRMSWYHKLFLSKGEWDTFTARKTATKSSRLEEVYADMRKLRCMDRLLSDQPPTADVFLTEDDAALIWKTKGG